MGRTPDYKAAFMASLAANPEFYAPFGDNAARLVQALRLAGALPQPRPRQPARRPQEAGPRGRRRLHPRRREDDAGIIVSGAKMLATGSALTHATFVAQNSVVPTWSRARPRTSRSSSSRRWTRPGASCICRTSYEAARAQPLRPPARRAASTRTTRSSSSTTPSSRGRTSSSTATSSGPTRFYRASGFFNRYNLQAAHPARRQARFHGRAVRQGHGAPTAPTSSAACRPRSASSSPGAT